MLLVSDCHGLQVLELVQGAIDEVSASLKEGAPRREHSLALVSLSPGGMPFSLSVQQRSNVGPRAALSQPGTRWPRLSAKRVGF